MESGFQDDMDPVTQALGRLVQFRGTAVQSHQRPRWLDSGFLAAPGLDSGLLAPPRLGFALSIVSYNKLK